MRSASETAARNWPVVAHSGDPEQASGIVFRIRDLLVRQRTQTINALRGHLSEYGIIAPNETCHVSRLLAEVESPHNSLPTAAHRRTGCRLSDRLGIGCVVLLTFDGRLYTGWGDQAHLVPQGLDLPPPMTGTGTGFHRNNTSRLRP